MQLKQFMNPYFVQLAALRYHFGTCVSNQQQLILINLLTQNLYVSPYQRASEGIRHISENVMRHELFRFLLNGFSVLQMWTEESSSKDESSNTTDLEKTINRVFMLHPLGGYDPDNMCNSCDRFAYSSCVYAAPMSTPISCVYAASISNLIIPKYIDIQSTSIYS